MRTVFCLEQQQALLLAVLRRAGGAAVSYSELKDAGIEFPASVVSELELAGVDIERCLGRGPGSRQVGVRLPAAADPDPEPAGAPVVSRPDAPLGRRWEPVRVYRAGPARALFEEAVAAALRLVDPGLRWARRAPAGRSAIDRRMLAPVALLVAAGVAAAVVASVLPAGGTPRVGAARDRYHARAIAPRRVTGVRERSSARVAKAAPRSTRSTSTGPTSAASGSTATAPPTTSSPPTPSTPPTESSLAPASSAPASAPDLEARGHGLMVSGQYDRAIPVLERTLRATGERSGACLEPSTQACLTYAFALYDLGRSLQLAGDPAAAVPVLEQRLRIDNQRQVVAAELAQARRQSGTRQSHARRDSR